MAIKKGNIGNALHSVAPDHVVTTTDEVFDETQNKYQDEINSGIGEDISDIESDISSIKANIGYYECSTGASTAAKTVSASGYSLVVGGAIKVKFINTNTASSSVTLNINGVGAKPLYYNGNLVDANHRWKAGEVVDIYYDGTNYQANSVEGGSGDGAYDISAEHLTEGNPTKYATLSEALGTNGANIPADKRKGGMSIKYIQTPDNKYVQYRLMATEFSTIPENWQGIDDVPTAGSDNLVKSGGTWSSDNNLAGKIGTRSTGEPNQIKTAFFFNDFKVIQGKSYRVRYVSGYRVGFCTSGSDNVTLPADGSFVTFTAANTSYAYGYVGASGSTDGKEPMVIDIVELNTFVEYLLERNEILQSNIDNSMSEISDIKSDAMVKGTPTVNGSSFYYNSLSDFMKSGESYYVKCLDCFSNNLNVKGTTVALRYNEWVPVVCGNSHNNIYIYFGSNIANYSGPDLLVVKANAFSEEDNLIWNDLSDINKTVLGDKTNYATKLTQETQMSNATLFYNDSVHPITKGTLLRFRFLNASSLIQNAIIFYNGISTNILYSGQVVDKEYIELVTNVDITKIGLKVAAEDVIGYGYLCSEMIVAKNNCVLQKINTNSQSIDVIEKNITPSEVNSNPNSINTAFEYDIFLEAGKTYYVKKISGYGDTICTNSNDITPFVEDEYVEFTVNDGTKRPYSYAVSTSGKTAPVIEIIPYDSILGKVFRQGKIKTTIINVSRNDGLTAIADAINAITDASPTNRYIVHIKGVFHFTDPQDLTMYDGTEYSAILMKPYVDVEGEGPDNSVLFVDFPANANFHEGKSYNDYQPVYFHGTGGTIRNMKIIGKNCRYAVHIERMTPYVGEYEINVDNCEVISLGAPDYGSGGFLNTFGTGMTPGQTWNIRNCKIINAYNFNHYTFAMHTPLTLFEKVGTINFENCIFKGAIILSNYQVENNTIVNMRGCSFFNPKLIFEYYNNRNFSVRGDYTTILFNGDSQKFLYYTISDLSKKGCVLRITSLSMGVTSVVRFNPTSSAFNAIIGDLNIDAADKTIYDWNTQYGMVYRDGGVGLSGQAFGTLDIDEESSTATSSLGAKLGDCSTTNKILVVSIDGTDYTITFNEDYTNKDNDYIIGKINDVIGSVATADVFSPARLYYPNINGLCEVESGDSGAILKGMGVVFNSSGKMVKAKSADGYIDGICLDDTSLGQTGRVITMGFIYDHRSTQWFRIVDVSVPDVESPLTFGDAIGIDPDNDGKFKKNATPSLLRYKANCLEIID